MKRSAAIVVTLLSTTAVGASAAEAGALPPKTSFTVVTSFVTQPSQIIEADGPWADCTGVADLSNYANQVAPRTVRFSGEKQVLCASGDFVIHYDADLTFENRKGRTFGTWVVVSSTNPNIQGGSGTVQGDPTGCADCIVDTFTGRVY